MPLLHIHLEKLRFHAFHGLYETEKKTGNQFEFNLKLSFEPQGEVVNNISETINYADLYALIATEMKTPRELLETFLTELAILIKQRFPQTKSLNMSLYKLTVPISNFEGRIGVEVEKYF
ncbi:MAG: dihydroneopterin aldolase [Niabella sp.]